MSEPQVTTSGPARLRALADKLDLKNYLYGFDKPSSTAQDIRQMAALWESERAALEIAQAKADLIGGEVCAEARAAGSGPCGSCAWCVKQATDRAERAEAALERARALVPFLRRWIETMQSEQGYEDEGTMAWRSWQDMIAEVENGIAALLAPASGGAA